MDDETRKMMTEWLGECWHDGAWFGHAYMCKQCKSHLYNPATPYIGINHRTFTTPDDMMACKNRLVELGLFVKFYMWAWDNWFETGPEWWSARFANWLIDPARFCQLAADFLKGRE